MVVPEETTCPRTATELGAANPVGPQNMQIKTSVRKAVAFFIGFLPEKHGEEFRNYITAPLQVANRSFQGSVMAASSRGRIHLFVLKWWKVSLERSTFGSMKIWSGR